MSVKSRHVEVRVVYRAEQQSDASLPAVGERLQCHRGRHFQRLPGQVFVDELLGASGQRA